MHRHFLPAAILTTMIAAACGQSQEKAICALADATGIPSMQLTSYEGGKTSTILHNARRDDVFQAASLSKPVFSYIIMRLADEGKIALDTPVCNYTSIERFEDRQMAQAITARMVLSHTTGLYNWACSPTSDKWSSSTITFHFPADSCFGYSGEAYAFLQRAAEDITHKPLDQLAKEYVFEPFGMPLSSYQWRSEYDSLAVEGHDAEGNAMGRWEGIQANSAYTLRTTSEEYMSFLVHAIINGEGLSECAHSEWLSPRSKAIRFFESPRECDQNMHWCLGMGVTSSCKHWHWGDNDYWKSLFVVDTEKKRAMCYFTNSSRGHEMCDDICRRTLGESFDIQSWIGESDDE